MNKLSFLNSLKSSLKFLITITAFAIMFAACSQDEQPEMIQEGQSLKINISIAGFVPDNPATRASESNYTTTFTSNDEIGITVLSSNNEILQDNVACKYTGSIWTPAGGEKVTYYSGATYLVYYPYSATMDGKKTEDEILSAFTPQTDQSSYSAYTASDLMTGTGTVSDATLNVSFTHAFALMEVKLSAKYTLLGTTHPYKTAPSLNPVFSVNNVQVPFYLLNDSVFRYIVKPNIPMTVSGVFSDVSWSKQLTPQAGQYKRLNVNGSVVVSPSEKFAVGDYYPISDDPFCAMGVVYEISNDGTNGRAVSIEEVHTTWDYSGAGGDNAMKGSDTDKDNGALNTGIIKDLPVFALAKAKNGGGTSPWYIPASNELLTMMKIIENNSNIRLNINAASGGQVFPEVSPPPVGYWTSTRYQNQVIYCNQYGAKMQIDIVSTKCYVRAIMKF